MNFQQQPHTLVMIRPKAFGFNDETAMSNVFQQKTTTENVLAEFDRMTDLLASHEIPVLVFDDTEFPPKPDAIFPNNWFTTHGDGTVVLYPMMAPNRRAERRPEIVDSLSQRFAYYTTIDLTEEEKNNVFLEGTGSLVFDHVNRIAYAAESPRTNKGLVERLCVKLQYKPIIFEALDEHRKPIYHTNVVLSVGEKFAIVCLDAIMREEHQEEVLKSFASTDHKVIAISYEQMRNFAGNALEIKNAHGENLVLMSGRGFNSLLPGQINAITKYSEILPVAIPTIETVGGGSVRCMVAGIHLPPVKKSTPH